MKIKWDKYMTRRVLVMTFGILLMGLGVSLFKLSVTGNDPSSAFSMAVAARVGLPFSVTLSIVNCIWFISEITLGRHYIGIGTFVNWFGVGIFADMFLAIAGKLNFAPEPLPLRLLVMVAGILVLSCSCAIYQTADVGVAPYDAMSLIMDERLPLPYFWCRIIIDTAAAILAWLLGGIIGIGTLVCALGLGPFITFFTAFVAKPLLKYDEWAGQIPE